MNKDDLKYNAEGINRYIVGCKYVEGLMIPCKQRWINRYIVGCKYRIWNRYGTGTAEN